MLFESIAASIERARSNPIANEWADHIAAVWKEHGQPELSESCERDPYEPVFADAEHFGEAVAVAYNVALSAMLATIGIQRADDGTYWRGLGDSEEFDDYAELIEDVIEHEAEFRMIRCAEVYVDHPEVFTSEHNQQKKNNRSRLAK